MNDFEILKSAEVQNFNQCYDKNLNLNQDKKVVFSARSSLSSLDFGHIDINGMFSLFKNSERYITPILNLEKENFFKIKYNLIKSSATMDINFPKENSLLKSINYQITPDKSNSKLTQNKMNFLFKKNFKLVINNDSNESYIHISHKIKDIGRFKYKFNNKKKNNFQIALNYNILKNVLFYYNNIELNVNNFSLLNKNIHGFNFGKILSPSFSYNFLGGLKFNNTILSNYSLGCYTKHNITNSLRFENCFVINKDINQKNYLSGFVAGFGYKNFFNFKIKLLKNEVRSYLKTKFKNFTLSANFNYEINTNLNNNTIGNNNLNKNPLKYSIILNFK